MLLVRAGDKAVDIFNVTWSPLNTMNQYLNDNCPFVHAEVIGLKFPSYLVQVLLLELGRERRNCDSPEWEWGTESSVPKIRVLSQVYLPTFI